MGPAAMADLKALLAAMETMFGLSRPILIGGSMGGTGALIYAACNPADLDAVVALCPATDLPSYYHWCCRQGQPVHLEIRQAMETAYAPAGEDVSARLAQHSALDRARHLTMPLLVMHGDADATIPVSQSRRFAEAIGEASQFPYLEIAGGDHDSPLGDPHLYEWLALWHEKNRTRT